MSRPGRALARRLYDARWNPLRLLESPPVVLDGAKVEAFQTLLSAAGDGVVEYDLPWPKHELLQYLVTCRELLLHGSNRRGTSRFEPRDQGDFEGKPVRAVFATDDEIWPIYFAIVNRARVRGLTNGVVHVHAGGSRRSRYFFAISADPRDVASWTAGAVYAVPRATFVQQRQPREWLSAEPVDAAFEVPVEAHDFPFIADVLGYRLGEPVERVVVRQTLRGWRATLARAR